MSRYCKQCGAPLTETARFCRRCGTATGMLTPAATPQSQAPTVTFDRTEPIPEVGSAPTTPLSPGETRADASPSSFNLTAPPPPTELMTRQLPEAIPAHPSQPQALPTKSRWALVLSVALGLAVVAGVSFYLGSRWSASPPLTRPAASPSSPARAADELALDKTTNATATSPTAKQTTKRKAEASQPAHKTPVGAEQYLRRGTEYLNAKRYEEALKEYAQVRRLEPANKDVYYLIGQAHHHLGQLELALQAYQQCTSGPYAALAQQHVKRLEKKLTRSK